MLRLMLKCHHWILEPNSIMLHCNIWLLNYKMTSMSNVINMLDTNMED